MFEPTAIPSSGGGLRAWLATMMRNIADALAAPEVQAVHFAILNAQPSKYSNGDVVYADGTNWNPGSGAGLYERRSGAWAKL
jgi:hypothetical protein